MGLARSIYLSTHTGASAAAVELALEADAMWTGTTSVNGRAIQMVYAGGY